MQPTQPNPTQSKREPQPNKSGSQLRGVIERITFHNEENGYTVAKLLPEQRVFTNQEYVLQ